MAANNPMIPTPTLPGAGYYENLYRGRGLSELAILRQQMRLGGLKCAERIVDVGGGVTIKAMISYNDERVYVRVPNKSSSVEWVEVPLRAVAFRDQDGAYRLLNTENMVMSGPLAWNNTWSNRGTTSGHAFLHRVTALDSYGTSIVSTEPVHPWTDVFTLSGGLYWYDTIKMGACRVGPDSLESSPVARSAALYGAEAAKLEYHASDQVPPSVGDIVLRGLSYGIRCLSWNDSTGWKILPLPVAAVVPVAAASCTIGGHTCIVVSVQMSLDGYTELVGFGLPASPDASIQAANGVFPLHLLCYDQVDKTWTQLLGDPIATRPYALDADLTGIDPMSEAGEFDAIFPYYWYWAHGFSYIRWELECAISGDGLVLGFTWKGGPQSAASRADTWEYYSNRGYASMDSFLDEVAYHKFYYTNAGHSDYHVVGGQFEQFKVTVLSKTAYSLTYQKQTTTDCFTVTEGPTFTLDGEACRQAHRQFNVGFLPAANDLDVLYCREYYYHAVENTTVVQDDPLVTSTAHTHGSVTSLRKTPHSNLQARGEVAGYPALPLDTDEIVLHYIEFSKATAGDMVKTYQHHARERFTTPIQFIVDGSQYATMYGDVQADSDQLDPAYTYSAISSAAYRLELFGSVVHTSSTITGIPFYAAPVYPPPPLGSSYSSVDMMDLDLILKPNYRPSELALLQVHDPRSFNGFDLTYYIQCPWWWIAPMTSARMTSFNDYWTDYLDTGIEGTVRRLGSTVALDMTTLGGLVAGYNMSGYYGSLDVIDVKRMIAL